MTSPWNDQEAKCTPTEEKRIEKKFHPNNMKDLEFFSWGDVGFDIFDKFDETYKMQALITLQPHIMGQPKFTFATIDKNSSQSTTLDGTGEVWSFHISSPVWSFDGISYYYKTLEEAKDVIRAEARRFVEAFFK